MPRRSSPILKLPERRLALSTLTAPASLGARAAVGRSAARIPLPGPALLPLWESELATVSRGEPRSALQARRDVLLALDPHLRRGVESGAIAVKGPASRLVSRPAVRCSRQAEGRSETPGPQAGR